MRRLLLAAVFVLALGLPAFAQTPTLIFAEDIGGCEDYQLVRQSTDSDFYCSADSLYATDCSATYPTCTDYTQCWDTDDNLLYVCESNVWIPVVDLAHGDLSDMPDVGGVVADHDARYYTETEIGSNTLGSSGASLVGMQSLDGTATTVQLAVDGTQSSIYFTGCDVTENATFDGTIDISECIGAIKTTADNEGLSMGAFTVAAAAGLALAAGRNFVCVDYDGGTPVFLIQTAEPNHSTVFSVAVAYKDSAGHLHFFQGGHKFLGFPFKAHKRLSSQFGLTRTSGLVTTEHAVHALALNVSAGVMWKGVHDLQQLAVDTGNNYDITGGGAGGTISANNTIVLDSGAGDVTAKFLLRHGQHITIMVSSNGNNGGYHVQTSTWDGANTTVVIEEITLNVGADTGHVHDHPMLIWHYDFTTLAWVMANFDGFHAGPIIDVDHWNDIDAAAEFNTYTPNRYGTAWIYRDVDDDVHYVYGQGDYTLSQAIEVGPPASLPDIINKMCFLIAKIVFKESAVAFTEIYYPWTTTFSATGASDHGGLANLTVGDDHTQYTRKDTLTAKGSIYGATAASTPGELAVGTNGQCLVAASGETTGLDWDTCPTVAYVFNAHFGHVSPFSVRVVGAGTATMLILGYEGSTDWPASMTDDFCCEATCTGGLLDCQIYLNDADNSTTLFTATVTNGAAVTLWCDNSIANEPAARARLRLVGGAGVGGTLDAFGCYWQRHK